MTMRKDETREIKNAIRLDNQRKFVNFDKVEISLIAGRKPLKEKYKSVPLQFDN